MNNNSGKFSKSQRLNLHTNSYYVNNDHLSNINNTTYSMIRNKSNNNIFNTKNGKFSFGNYSNINNNQHYCPYCSHCNNIQDSNMDILITTSREAKNMIANSFEYILRNNVIESNNISIFHSNGNYKEDKEIMQDIEILLNHHSKFISHKNNRLVYMVVAHFLDSLLSEKVSLENIINNEELIEKFEKIISSKIIGLEKFDEKGFFDDELEELFDIPTKEKIKKLIRSKILKIKIFNYINFYKEIFKILFNNKLIIFRKVYL